MRSNMTSEKDIIVFLQEAKSRNLSTVEMLSGIQEMTRSKNPDIKYVKCFMDAFQASLKEMTPLLGWEGFGRTISSSKINEMIDPHIYKSKC
jgi:hypothetical protein